jgi:hypothetical protein
MSKIVARCTCTMRRKQLLAVSVLNYKFGTWSCLLQKSCVVSVAKSQKERNHHTSLFPQKKKTSVEEMVEFSCSRIMKPFAEATLSFKFCSSSLVERNKKKSFFFVWKSKLCFTSIYTVENKRVRVLILM